MLRQEAAVLAKEKFDLEETMLSRDRRIPMTDSFSGKYDLVTA